MKIANQWLGLLVLVALLCLWELVTRAGLVSPRAVPPASEVLRAGLFDLWYGDLSKQAGTTIRRIALGFGWASLIAIPVGILLGRSRTLYAAFWPLFEFLRPMPIVAVMPILIFFLGLGDRMSTTMTAIGAGWYILINTVDGIRSVDPVLIETGRTFRVARLRQLWTIYLPAAAPQIFTGLRLALGIAVIVTVVVEMASGFGGGLGSYISTNSGSFRLPEAYAGIGTVALIGYGISRLFLVLEHRLMRWHIQSKAGLQ